MLFTVGSRISSNQFKSYGIIQTFFVNYISNDIFFSAFDIAGFQFFHLIARYDFNRIPFSNHFFFPSSNFFRFCIVVSRQNSETFSQLIVELRIVVIQLTFHCIMGSNLSDRILHYLNPAFRISFLIASIVQRKNFSFKNTVNSSSI